MTEARFTFTQLGGPRRQLILAGSAAPHGRPRQQPVVTDGIELREDEVYYSGNAEPTRHIFGIRYSDWDIDGRWSNVYEGPGFAKGKTEDVRQFVAEAQQCRITWGDLVSVRGLIVDFQPGRESEGEVEWSMTIRVDGDEVIPEQPDLIGLSKSGADALRGASKITELADDLLEVPETMTGSVFDSLNGLVSSLNSVWASTLQVAEQIDSLATAPFALIQRFRAGLHQVSTAIGNLRATYDQFQADSAVESERAAERQRLLDAQARWDAASLAALDSVWEADREAELAQTGQIRAMVDARDGDTWEAISIRVYGDASRADDIRETNSVEPGAPPVSGVTYLAPV